MTKAKVTLYSRPGCHLCDEVKRIILTAGVDGEFTLEILNIEEDPTLERRYRNDIPVVAINGVESFKGSVDPEEFRRKLRESVDDSSS